jgi:adenosylcobinamide-GDP ribazoletransferase
VRLPRTVPDRAFPNAVALFPLIGWAIGVAVGAFDAVASRALPAFVVAALDLTALVVLTGALHIDGIADSADGILGDLPRERRLEVMREPGVGAFGIVAVVLVLLLEYGALISLAPAIHLFALVTALTLSRWTMSLLLVVFPYARGAGVASPFRAGLSWVHLAISSALALALLLWPFGALPLAFAVAAAAPALLVGWLALRRLGGCTGDVYGAGGELAFAAVLVAFSAIRG